MPLDLTSCSTANGVVTLDCVGPIIASIIFWLLTFAGIVALIFVIFGGFKFLTSGGEKEKVEGARKTLTWSIVGLILILSSFMIVRLVGQVTGITCISAPFNPGGVFSFGSCGLPKTTCDDNNVPACPNKAEPVCVNGTWDCGIQDVTGTPPPDESAGCALPVKDCPGMNVSCDYSTDTWFCHP